MAVFLKISWTLVFIFQKKLEQLTYGHLWWAPTDKYILQSKISKFEISIESKHCIELGHSLLYSFIRNFTQRVKFLMSSEAWQQLLHFFNVVLVLALKVPNFKS